MNDQQQDIKPWVRTLLPWAVMALLLAIYHLIFRDFFPGPKGMGHDYSGILPMMLDNFRWYLNNGLWSPPWFSPGFCGGIAAFPDPQWMYYSLHQLLGLVTDPVTAVYLNMLIFDAAGLIGMYLLLVHVFRCKPWSALLGAGLFALNGFFAHRMLVGHLTFDAVMLTPWLTLALLWSPSQANQRGPATLVSGILGGAVLTYWVFGGLGTMIPAVLISIAGIMAMYGMTHGSWSGFFYRCLVAATVSVGLCISKLSAVFAFMGTLPRSDYLLPGMDSVWQTLRLAFLSLFLSPADIEQTARAHMANVQWMIGRHELEYGISIAPLLIALLALAVWAWQARQGLKLKPQLNPARIGWLALLLVVLAIPIALNTYTPGWNAILKEIPFIKSASNLFRWFFIYIPVVTVATAIILDRIPLPQQARIAVAIGGLVVALGQLIGTDQQFYKNQSYNPATITKAFKAERASQKPVPIRGITVFRDQKGHLLMPPFRNDTVAQGLSQLLCYNAAFGYRLEHFPIKTLHPGPLGDVKDGKFNLKDPACYVFPAENSCSPGDQFPTSRLQDAKNFAQYHPFSFKRSQRQIWADRASAFSLYTVPLLLLAGIVWWMRIRLRTQATSSIPPDGGQANDSTPK